MVSSTFQEAKHSLGNNLTNILFYLMWIGILSLTGTFYGTEYRNSQYSVEIFRKILKGDWIGTKHECLSRIHLEKERKEKLSRREQTD